MKCLQCGWCCKNLSVMIVDDPIKGIKKDNIIHHNGLGNSCKHLKQISKFKYICSIHHYKWYKKTPCFNHSQIERNKNDPCRMGQFILERKKCLKYV